MPGALVAEGRRVALRTVEEEDAAFNQRVFANPPLRYPMGQPIESRTEVAERIGEGDADSLLVTLEDDPDPGSPDGDGRRIGVVHVSDADWRRPELGYWLVPDAHGEGYGKEAVSVAIDHAFRAYDRPAVEAKAYDFNEASRGLLESLGFQQEGRLRKRRFIDGAYRDTIQYGLLREEWEKREE